MSFPTEQTQRIEANEIAAYCSFVKTATALHGEEAFQIRSLGTATAFVSPLVEKPGVFNRVMGLGLWDPATPERVDDILALYRHAGCRCGIDLAPVASTPELLGWLRSRRIRRGALAAVLNWKPCAVPTGNARVRVVRAAGPELDEVASICAQVFGMPDAVRQTLAALPPSDGWRHWLAYLGEVPVAAALSFVHGQQCWFGWAATLPVHRGLGAKGTIDNARTSDAYEAGCTLVTSETAVSTPERPDPSFRSFQRIGFEQAYIRSTYFCT